MGRAARKMMKIKETVSLIKKMGQYANMYAANINGHELEFTGWYYGRLVDPSSWQFGVCSVCGNVSGRTSIGRTDYCFCLEHKEVWESGENIFCDQKARWYTEEIRRKNYEFLQAVSGENSRNKPS
jgi:hypothetical protein